MDPQQKQEAKYKTKALMGIINDKMEVGMAKIRGEESAALDVAIIKATLQDEVVPKEKHVRTLKAASGATSPRQTVNYVIHGLTKRLEENPKAWLVTLKTLIVFHRLMRETDPSFQDELLRFAERTGHHRMLRLESFADHTTKETWDLSAWIRVYSLYLDERLSVFRTMRFDPEQDKGVEARDSKLKSCPANELLEHLPAVQKLLGRLVSCIPEGAAQTNEIALLACSLVLMEVRSVYKVVSEGIFNLADRFFEMDRTDALKGIELVKENLVVNERLNAFVGSIGNIPPLRGAVQFPAVTPLPADFLTTLEDYVKDAPKTMDPKLRSSTTLARSGSARLPAISPSGAAPTRLVVGGPIKDAGSGPTSPDPAAAPPAPVVDLLGGFDSLTVSGAPAATAAAAAAPAAPQAPPAAAQLPPPGAFDPFGAGAAHGSVSTPVPGAYAQPPAAPGYGYPPPPQASSFANPAVAAAAVTGGSASAGAVPPHAPPPPGANAWAENAFATGAFGSTFSPPQQPHAPAGYPQAPVGYPGAPPPQQPQAPAPPAAAGPLPANFNPFGGAPAAAPGGFAVPSLNVTGSPGGVPSPASALTPTPAAAPANPFGSPGGAPANPFGGAAPPANAATAASNNPFGSPGAAAAVAAGWTGAQQQPVVVTNVGGYSLKKPADPLMDLSLDLFGKPQAPPTQQPMRPQGGPMGANGSPGGAFF